jgi:hypothetical protein
MLREKERLSINVLHVVVGVIVLIESLLFALGDEAARVVAHLGLPPLLRPVLGGLEALAAIVFLIPRTVVVGGWALLVIFALASIVHVLHGQYNVGSLVVLAAAVFAVMAHRAGRTTQAS